MVQVVFADGLKAVTIKTLHSRRRYYHTKSGESITTNAFKESRLCEKPAKLPHPKPHTWKKTK